MLQTIRNSRFTKGISLLLAIQLFLSGMDWNVAYAGDGGPTQPEVHSFEPVGTDQMVDLFTGDFTYNIPLFNLPGPDGGYPINIAYHSGAQMDQEASWVGLGWNINMGTINRQIRNLPDDFGGDQEENITIKTDMRPNWTVGITGKKDWELFGFSLGNGGIAAIPAISAGTTIYYNNYKGIGYSRQIGLTLKIHDVKDGSLSNNSGDLGFHLKLDSKEGISSNVSTGINYSMDIFNRTNGVSTGFNNRSGWQRNLMIQNSTSNINSRSYNSASGGSNLSFSGQVVQISTPSAMRGINASFSFGKGPNTPGLLKKNSIGVNYGSSSLKNRNKSTNHKGIGYMYYQKAYEANAYDEQNDVRVLDHTRENDGLIHKDTRRLATPTLSYDIYSVTGQGIGNMFRPVRSDIGMISGPFVESKYYGGDLGFERNVGGTNRLGIDLGFQYTGDKSTHWPYVNVIDFFFQETDASLTKSVYFKNYGELSADDLTTNYGASIASNKPVAYGLNAENNFYDITNIDQNSNGSAIQIVTQRPQRHKRAVGIEAFTNGMIMQGTSSLIPEFNLSYYQSGVLNYSKSFLTPYDDIRTNLTKTHVGGYMATNESGMRYVYGLPAQNNIERDVAFTVAETPTMLNQSQLNGISQTIGGEIDYKQDGTDKYYNSVEKEGYAHSYLLTSILGQDFVEMDNIAGPSDGDLGYWVRFNYLRAHDNYKWRSPYKGALYDKGYETSFTDGKGRYSYGEKEIWYVATVETKTHIAEFIVSSRNDCKQVANELSGNVGSGAYSKLDRIDVYAKSERYPNGSYNGSAKPIQSCHFTYDYSLGKGTPDNNDADGKLTLKSCFFTYRNNLAGSARPYEFEYNEQIGGQAVDYAPDAVDRWGNYQPGANAANIDYPYNDPLTAKATMDERASLWNLKAINLPSGGRYEVDYESDSYAYVQNEVAMHMFKIASLDPYNNGNATTAIDHEENATADHRKVYFQLEKPIPISLSVADRKKLMQRYIREGEYLYFKVKINLTNDNGAQEYVGGYAQVDAIDVDENSNVGGNYIWGSITLDFMKVNGQDTKYHPFTEAGSRHIRYNQPSLLYEDAPNADLDQLSKSQIKNVGQSLFANKQDIFDMFKDFTAMLYKNGNDRLSDINLNKSYLRLRTPDKIKYGGGHRVREVRVIDNWASSFLSGGEASSTYGTVYEYDMTDENGEVISSGVAAYEPMVGGDEIALRNPVEGWEDKNIASKTTAQTYTEEPGNESLFPGPTVGYRQVKVMSKNTSIKKNNLTSNVVNYGGITIHEFYTAKDYPVITDNTELETDKTFRKSRLIIPALIVNIDRLRMAATQGYYIELNDMHGKPKGAREIAFNSNNVEEEISSVKYEYFDVAHLTTNRAGETFVTRSLKNDVDVMYKDVDPTNLHQSDIRLTSLATEIEFIPETRYHQSRSISAGLQLNFDFTLSFPLLFPVPSFNWKEEKTGTVVTNKIVNKAGIMKKVTATQRGSVATTENLVFDDLTGMPLLTSLTNDYGGTIYNYSILAKDQYDATGGAYLNIGFSSIATAVGTSPTSGLQEITLNTPAEASNFVPGDQLLATPVLATAGNDVDPLRNKILCIFSIKNQSNANLILETVNGLSGLYRFTVIRSGRRNNLTSSISSITALSNPTKNREIVPCTDNRNVKFPQYYNIYTIDNVLAINAVELGSNWYKETRQLPNVPGTWYDDALFSKGFGGTFAPVRSYAYIDNRSQNTTSNVTDVKLATDGIMNDVSLFNWGRLQSTSVSEGCVTKWREVDQITLKNPSSFDIETRNILQTYSAQIYGRSGTEPIAVAGNARNAEIGVENFEEYAAGSLDITQNASNNLNFYSTILNPGTARFAEDRFDVTGGADNKGTIAVPYTTLSGTYTEITARIHFDAYRDPNTSIEYKAEEILVRLPLTQLSTNGAATFLTLPNTINVPKSDDRKWRGEVFARKTLPNYPATANSSTTVKTGVGHTGNKCLATVGSISPKFMQSRLKLIEGKEYQFSGWFSTPDNAFLLKNYSTLLNTNFQVEFFNAGGTLLSTQTFNESDVLQGTFIDEWQKFTLNFTMPAGAHYASVTLACANEVFDINYGDGGDYVQMTYYDDLRIQPRDAGMMTYVYNQENQRLEAQLDDNNYATFYYYDDEGNLFLVKRETEKGIITVQESRSYLRK